MGSMGSHEWADHPARTAPGPAPGRLRVLIGRSAAIVLILGALTWISISLLFNPPPKAPAGVQEIPLQVIQSTDGTAAKVPDGSTEPGDAPQTLPAEQPGSTRQGGGAKETGDSPVGGASVVVHLIGAVKNPGVYTLTLGSRVLDAVKQAGGLAKDAAPESINLATELADGEQVRIPRRGESAPIPAPGAGAEQTDDAPGATSGSGQGKVNLNTADATRLQELPGIGPALSGRIIEFRDANGPFRNLAELDAVSGIGPAMMGNLKNLVVFE